MDEIEALRTELKQYRAEKEKIRDVIGQISGVSTKKRDTTINVVFLAVVVGFFVFDVVRHALGLNLPFLPPALLLEVAVLLVSIKIIWMIYRQGRVDHFQFWILNSIEFQMNMISRRLTNLEKAVRTNHSSDSETPTDQPSQEAKAERR